MPFRKARRSLAYARVGLVGPAGSGKTLTSLLLAYGLVGDWSKIGHACTEGGSGELYAGLNLPAKGIQVGRYLFTRLEPPFTPSKYTRAIDDAINQGLKAIILDSISHAWAGEGGLLEKKDLISQSGHYNQFTAWREVTPEHNRFVEAMIQSNIHVFATLRAKTEYVLEKDDKGNTMPRKIGMAPVQREGLDYEFTLVLELSQKHVAAVSKDRTSVFDGCHFTPSVQTGRALKNWLDDAQAAGLEEPQNLASGSTVCSQPSRTGVEKSECGDPDGSDLKESSSGRDAPNEVTVVLGDPGGAISARDGVVIRPAVDKASQKQFYLGFRDSNFMNVPQGKEFVLLKYEKRRRRINGKDTNIVLAHDLKIAN